MVVCATLLTLAAFYVVGGFVQAAVLSTSFPYIVSWTYLGVGTAIVIVVRILDLFFTGCVETLSGAEE